MKAGAVRSHLGGLAVVAILIGAAADGDGGIGQGIAVGLVEDHLHLGCRLELEAVEGVELQHGGIPLAGLEVGMVDGAEVEGIVHAARGEPHVAGDAVGLIERQNAVVVGIDGLLHALPVDVLDGGLHGGAELEEVELLAQGGDVHRDAVLHAGLGMGGGDGGRAVHGGGKCHGGAGQVGVVVEYVDIFVQAALLVVHRDDAVVAARPLDAVLIGVPVIFLVVDVHILDEPQLLPQRQDVRRGGGQIAADLGGIVQGQGVGKVVSFAVLERQCVGIVDIEGEGIGAGCVAGVFHGEHNLVGILEVVVPHGFQFQVVAAVGGTTGALAIDGGGGVVLLHADDGQGDILTGGSAVAVFYFPGDVDGARVVQEIGILRRGKDGLGRHGLHHNPGHGREPDIRAAGVGMGHGDQHGIGRHASHRELIEHICRNLAAVLVLIHRVGCDRGFPFQRGLRFKLSFIERHGEVKFHRVARFIRGKFLGVGDPEHRGRRVLPRHDGGGAGGDGQRQVVAGGDGVGDRGFLVVGLIFRRAVVGGEGDGHLAQLLAGGYHGDLQGISLHRDKGDDAFHIACPAAGGRRGGLVRVRGLDRGGQGRERLRIQGQLANVGDIRSHLNGIDVHIGRHREVGGEPEGVHPVGLFFRAFVDLEGRLVGGILLLALDGQRVGDEGLLLGDGHGAGVGLSAVVDQNLEGRGLAAVVVGNGLIVVMVDVQGEGDAGLHVVCAGGQRGGGKAEHQALQGHARNLLIDGSSVSKDVGNAVGAGNGELGGILLLHGIPEEDAVAGGIGHAQLLGGEVMAVDVHHRAAADLDQLVKLQHHGHPLAGAVIAADRGDGGAAGVVAVVAEGDGLIVEAYVNPSNWNGI